MQIKTIYLNKKFKINDFDIKLINRMIDGETITINHRNCFIQLCPCFLDDVLSLIVLNNNKHDIFNFSLDFDYLRKKDPNFIFAIKQFLYNYIK